MAKYIVYERLTRALPDPERIPAERATQPATAIGDAFSEAKRRFERRYRRKSRKGVK
jgi:hypothetical protein